LFSLVCHVSRPSHRRLIVLPLAAIQNLLLLAIGAYPCYLLLSQKPTSLTTTDIVLGVLALIDQALEFTADNQQQSFQTFKHSNPRKLKAKEQWPGARIRWTEEDAARGYVSKGLWAWSRHPNFLAEQTFWVRFALFLAVLGAHLFHDIVDYLSIPFPLWSI
jgi:steroid 5-alpha reductase family enzyme